MCGRYTNTVEPEELTEQIEGGKRMSAVLN
jgi:hypothetical protein